MKLGNLNSLHIGLIVLVVVAVIVTGVSISRQKKAENQVMAIVGAIKSAKTLEQLQASADAYIAYSGAGSHASAQVPDSSCDSGYRAERGGDAGRCTGTGDWSEVFVTDGHAWWNPVGWF